MTATAPYSTLTGTYSLDPAFCWIGFVVRHAMVTRVRGSFTDFTGIAHVNGGDPSQSRVTVEIEVKSIDTRDADRDEHLRGSEFLQLADYPTITFVSTGITQTGETTFDVTGDLTIKDVTRSITVPFEYQGHAKDTLGNERIGFEGSTAISRKDFGITWNAALETGGVLVGDKVTLEFEISAVRQA
jgi:polyisoprenoid-binding protein YceI